MTTAFVSATFTTSVSQSTSTVSKFWVPISSEDTSAASVLPIAMPVSEGAFAAVKCLTGTASEDEMPVNVMNEILSVPDPSKNAELYNKTREGALAVRKS